MNLFHTNYVHGLIAVTTLIPFLTQVHARNDRCEITDPCSDASDCPILQNYPSVVIEGDIVEGYDPKEDPDQNINECIETVCQNELENDDPFFRKFYFNTIQETVIINLQCWDDDNSCYSIQEYVTVEKSRRFVHKSKVACFHDHASYF